MTNKKWIPTEEPYRISWVQSGSHLPFGWASREEVFPTEEAAMEAIKRPFPAGVVKAELDIAINPENWSRAGYWKRIGSRKRKADFVKTKAR